ncbi:hypothetical protein [Frateuria sp. STR12]|uniref:hypothetical protein n=1 Tax=Frateuria hangzhouensis TaxID=2995589 RepID=UPI002260A1E1|nr:hypothetical protein [Frateuria sp. STR12]MCX7513033.1 hypothetical protein [Frateuria sp. STR12]
MNNSDNTFACQCPDCVGAICTCGCQGARADQPGCGCGCSAMLPCRCGDAA